MLLCRLLSFAKSTFSKTSFGNTTRASNSLDSNQARRFVRPDLGPNCLQISSADLIWTNPDECKQIVPDQTARSSLKLDYVVLTFFCRILALSYTLIWLN